MAVGDINPLVPTADATTNVYQKEVVGNKADAANETGSQASLIGLARAIIARLVTFGAAALATSAQAVAIIARLADPPGVDDAADVTPSDRIGMKADTVAGTSLVALNRQELAAVAVVDGLVDTLVASRNTGAHSSYPTGADGAANFAPVGVLGGAANTLGAWIQIAAAGPAADFRITGMSVWPEAATDYEVQVGFGAPAAEAEVARHSISVPAGQVGFQIEAVVNDLTVIPAGTRLAARIRSTAGANTPLVKIHTQIA